MGKKATEVEALEFRRWKLDVLGGELGGGKGAESLWLTAKEIPDMIYGIGRIAPRRGRRAGKNAPVGDRPLCSLWAEAIGWRFFAPVDIAQGGSHRMTIDKINKKADSSKLITQGRRNSRPSFVEAIRRHKAIRLRKAVTRQVPRQARRSACA
jgi:hypothetical protein